jgi:hypothetical protein
MCHVSPDIHARSPATDLWVLTGGRSRDDSIGWAKKLARGVQAGIELKNKPAEAEESSALSLNVSATDER